MITFDNGGRLVTDVSELPDLRYAKRLYADFETASGDKKLKSTNPWKNCTTAGIAVTVDDAQGAWYVPLGHYTSNNLPRENVEQWWFDLVDTAELWVNQNVKYDMHVSANDMGVLTDKPVLCTMTQAKLVDSDRLRYGLDALSTDWLFEDISKYEKAMAPYLHNNQDYGWIPADICGEYGCQDVITNRRLDHYIIQRLPEDMAFISGVERDMTTVLFHMERTGMRVDLQQLRMREMKIYMELQAIDLKLEKLVGRSFRPHVNEDCYDVLCNQYGLPVLEWTEEEDEDGEQPGNPSFNKKALAKYAVHPFAPHKVVDLIIRYRHLNTLNNFFVKKYQESAVWDPARNAHIMHPTYNQAVRTGRLSCKDPNAQQLSPDAKELILPDPGESIVSCDDSQIEYRTIVHYIKDEKAIAAYHDNPDTDFHQWVADIIGIKRKPAKTCNFLMGYGGGKKRLLKALVMNTELTGGIVGHVDQLVADGKVKPEHREQVFEQLATRRAEKVYDSYHSNLPGLKRTSRDVDRLCRQRGWVKNAAGRRRHLPKERAHIGFNAINQSLATDMMKDRMVRLFKYIQEHRLPIKFMAQVHDELTLTMPTVYARDPNVQRELVGFMEDCTIKLRVPIRSAIGVSERHWREASKGSDVQPEPAPIVYAREELQGLKEFFGNVNQECLLT